jgi:hypothetical protein
MVQLNGKTEEMLHGFKAPHDAIKLGNGSSAANRWSAPAASTARTAPWWFAASKDRSASPPERGAVYRIDRPGQRSRQRDRRQPADRIAGRTWRTAE